MRDFFGKNAVALLSLTVAGLALYLSQFKEPKLEAHAGEEMVVYHPNGGELALIIPISFLNKSSRIGTAFRVAVVLYREDDSSRNYIMNWRDFRRLSKSRWVKSSDVELVPIPAGGSVSKNVRFSWEGPQGLQLLQGSYTLRVVIWNTVLREASSARDYSFNISASTASSIAERRGLGDSDATAVSLRGGFADSVVMNKEEVEALLGI